MIESIVANIIINFFSSILEIFIKLFGQKTDKFFYHKLIKYWFLCDFKLYILTDSSIQINKEKKNDYKTYLKNNFFDDYLLWYCFDQKFNIVEDKIYVEFSKYLSCDNLHIKLEDIFNKLLNKITLKRLIDIQNNRKGFYTDLQIQSIEKFSKYNAMRGIGTPCYKSILDDLIPFIQDSTVTNDNDKTDILDFINKNISSENKNYIYEIYGDLGTGKTTSLISLWKRLLFEEKIICMFFDIQDLICDLGYDSVHGYIIAEFKKIKKNMKDYEKIYIFIDAFQLLQSMHQQEIIKKFNSSFSEKAVLVYTTSNQFYIYMDNNFGNVIKKCKVCSLDEQIIDKYYDNSHPVSKSILTTPMILSLYIAMCNNKIIEDELIFKEVDTEAKFLWNYVYLYLLKKYNGDIDYYLFLVFNVLPKIAYLSEIHQLNNHTNNHNKTSSSLDSFFDNNEINIIFNIVKEIWNENEFKNPYMIKNIPEFNAAKQIPFLILNGRNGYRFSHDKYKAFFAAVNFVNDDYLYVGTGEHILLNSRYLDDSLLSNSYYNQLYYSSSFEPKILLEKNFLVKKLSERKTDDDLFYNIISDISCVYLFKDESSYSECERQKETICHYISNFGKNDYGMWSKAYSLERISKKYYDEYVYKNCITIESYNERKKWYDDNKKIINELQGLMDNVIKAVYDFMVRKGYVFVEKLLDVNKENIRGIIEFSNQDNNQIEEIRIYHVLGHVLNGERYKFFYESINKMDAFFKLSFDCYENVISHDSSNRFAKIGCIGYYKYLINKAKTETEKQDSYDKIYDCYESMYNNGNWWSIKKMAEMIVNKQKQVDIFKYTEVKNALKELTSHIRFRNEKDYNDYHRLVEQYNELGGVNRYE